MSDEFELEEEEFTSNLTSGVIKRILGLLRPHWKPTLGFIVTIALVSALDSVFTFINKNMIDKGMVEKNVNVLYQMAIYYGILIILQAGLVFLFIYLAGVLGERIQYDLRKKMFNHLQDLSLAFYSQTQVGRLIARVTSDTTRVSDLMTWGLVDTTWAIMNISTATIFMLIINWKLGLSVFLIVPALLFIAVKFRKKILLEYRVSRRANSLITGSYNETIQGVRVIKGLVREEENLNDFSKLTGKMFSASYKAAWISALFLPTVQIISAVALSVIVWYGGFQANTGELTIGGIHAFVSYLTFMLFPIQDLARVFSEMQHSIASAERIFKLIDSPPTVLDKPNAIEASTILGDITFENVSFSYDSQSKILEDFNLVVKQGEMIALVGPTGGGKSTIVNLLCRFYEPTSGRILFGKNDYTDYQLHSIHSKIGIVLQTPHLFSGSVLENIRYGRLEATNDEIIEAAKTAGAHEFILNLDKGYEENVGESGSLLSVGQKQLISLARAILAKPELFIMDEATSSVDTITESLIQQGMEKLMEGRTSFIIAHRLSTIRKASRIIVIDAGNISEIGTHQELLKLKGHYYKLYTNQFKFQKEEWFDSAVGAV